MAARQISAGDEFGSQESGDNSLNPTRLLMPSCKNSNPLFHGQSQAFSLIEAHSPLRLWLAEALVSVEAWAALSPEQQEQLGHAPVEQLIEGLVHKGLLTRYQAERIRSGNTQNLVIGNYRILSRLGIGGMGIVYKAEQIKLHRPVALKVLAGSAAPAFRLLDRFWAESRAVAQLQHPHIVAAIDAGEINRTHADDPITPYFVMEYLEGRDLEELIKGDGPLDVVRAVQYMSQIADALAEAHRHHLIHRDIKPSNIFITTKNQAKLLDFGLALQDNPERLTIPGMMLGTMGYVAPEQARDPRGVDARADLFSLGCTLYWSLTGEHPQHDDDNDHRLAMPSAVFSAETFRKLRPEVSRDIEEVLRRLMEHRPEDRFPDALSVYRALLPFLSDNQKPGPTPRVEPTLSFAPRQRTVLIVDDSPAVRYLCAQALQRAGYECLEAADGGGALQILQQHRCDLLLLDHQLPDMDGGKVLNRIRALMPNLNINVIMMCSSREAEKWAALRLQGVDECIKKPFTSVGLMTIVRAVFESKERQEQTAEHAQLLAQENLQLKMELDRTSTELTRTRDFLVQSLAELIGNRTEVSGLRSLRLQRYARTLTEEAANSPALKPEMTKEFCRLLELWMPLMDVGLLFLPEHFLIKAGELDAQEQELMRSHTTLGSNLLARIASRQPGQMAFFQMAITIARYHHERFDGQGYPDKLVGIEIPLPARFAAIVDVYDSLRCRRAYRPAMSHTAVVRTLVDNSTGQFDPQLLDVFLHCHDHFEEIFAELPEA